VFRTKGTWPRTSALFCYPVALSEWPDDPDLVERIPLRACSRRGAAIDVIADRSREHRSQVVYTRARGREMVFWQSPRTRKQARPDVRIPTARAAGVAELQIVVDAHERYPYGFSFQQVRTVRRALACGDYAVELGGVVVGVVERKSVSDLISSLTSGRLRFALAELATVRRAAVVVEDRYSAIFAQDLIRPAVVADGLAELQVRWPSVPIVFCDNRKLAEEWTYRYLAAGYASAQDEEPARRRADQLAGEDGLEVLDLPYADPESGAKPEPPVTGPSAAEVRAWARGSGITVPDRGRLRLEVYSAWRRAMELRSRRGEI
jgi:hypothetical protein